MAVGQHRRTVRTRDGEHLINITPLVDDLELGAGDQLAWIDRYPHQDDLVLTLPQLAPAWAISRPIRRLNNEFVINAPKRIVNQRDGELDEVSYDDIKDCRATINL